MAGSAIGFERSLGLESCEFVFALVPNFSMMAFTSAIEPLRIVNRIAGRELYRWRTLSLDGTAVRASNGVPLLPDGAFEREGRPPDAVVVCAGALVERFRNPAFDFWVKGMMARGAAIGGICTGTLVLARAGLLEGHRCTIHWENMEGLVEEFPRHEITATLFEIDRDRFTCSGGTAPIDLMLHLIARQRSGQLAAAVADQMMHVMRSSHDPQRMSLKHRTGISNAKILAAIAHMEAHLEIASSQEEIALAVGLSSRQLERLFRAQLGKSPSRYYLELRLHRARLLLFQTSMPVLQVAVACGFTSASHFARCYRSLFGHPPHAERQQPKPAAEQLAGV
jgi:AraC family transcriptional regulator, glycine betaine-responsive activator